VDSNLNYLMGRLSLVTQQFNQIRTGLGDVLDNIRSGFKEVEKEMKGKNKFFLTQVSQFIFNFHFCEKDMGPGPHNIPPNHDEDAII
jgi:hypothetical protein